MWWIRLVISVYWLTFLKACAFKLESLLQCKRSWPRLMNTPKVCPDCSSCDNFVVCKQFSAEVVLMFVGLCLTGGYPAPCYTPDGRLWGAVGERPLHPSLPGCEYWIQVLKYWIDQHTISLGSLTCILNFPLDPSVEEFEELLSLCYSILFTFGRLTAGRTPPTPLQSPPLLVLLAVFTQTPPTDSVHSCCHFTPTVVCLDYHPEVLIFHCPILSARRLHLISTHCAGTQDSWTVAGRDPRSPPRLCFTAGAFITEGWILLTLRRINIFIIKDFLKTTDPAVEMIGMSVHYVYMHVNVTQYSHSLSTCCWPFALENCVIARISESLGI